jgi:hypothetical protein
MTINFAPICATVFCTIGTIAQAGPPAPEPLGAPEAGVTGSVATLTAVAVVGAMAWERRRRNKSN